jgi:aerobic-type carbon monoxide dehydrogenase small subunit (CoxS/CutS family)
MKEKIQFTLNNKPQDLTVDPDRTLLWVLRTDLDLTGTKYGCGEGFCGACTVLIKNRAFRSCQVKISEVQNQEILTVEGLEKDGDLHPLQKAFIKHDALQCGYCTPGMILNAYDLLNRIPNPSYQEIVGNMEDNLCRCGAHKRIIQAIQEAGKEMRGGLK